MRKFLAILTGGSLLGWAMTASVSVAPSFASPVVRHSTPRNFTPVPNSVVTTAPLAGFLLGDGGLGNGPNDHIDVYDAAGIAHSGATSGRASGDFSLVSSPLSNMLKGWYAVHWNVESTDGHMAGGDDGDWWAFGVGIKTTPLPSKKLRLDGDVKLPSIPANLSGSINGLRTGTRKVSFMKSSATVLTVRIKLIESKVSTLVGAEFDWGVGVDKRMKTAYAIGAVPFPGRYRLTVQANVGSITGLWRTEIVIPS